ncbi:hypothetical protein QE418_003390 [Microbacterium testaceum]|uniref:hypothetical protein n=1 Tax=Microbacterium TaxID=33882 RepID=UPI00278A5E05|nr:MULTISPECIES: hypothetical protein [Microbacterium]MDQ1113942.1 hypothetical protein [Microbacterium testaceum]MDR6098951.1 hypothetical protein [Microbacterium sp. SORGH_AS_0454]
MLIETSIPGSDDWWLMRLADKLGAGMPRMERIRRYRDGDALLPENEWDAGTRESYKRWLKRSRLHIVEALRDAKTDRQRIVGFRTGATGDESGDVAAWGHWQRNRMKVQSRRFFNDTGDFGRSYLLVMPADDGPLWNVRNEWTTITEPNGLRPWLTEAGITVGYDQILQAEVVILYRPGYYRVAYRSTRVPTLPQNGTIWHAGNGWEWAGDRIVTPWTKDALLQQNSTLDGYGIYEKHLDTIDRINEITLNTITLIVTQAFRQRGVKGGLPEFYPEGHPNAGERIDYDELFKAGPAALWLLPANSEVWESNAVDITPIFQYRREEMKLLSSLTRTPQDMFDGDSQNQSATGAQVSREPLIHAVTGMNDQAEVTLAHGMAQSFQITGDTARADITEIEAMWAKVSPETLSAKAEAVAKMGGKPSQRYINSEVLEMTPAQMRQDEQDRASDMFAAVLAGSTATASGGPANTTGAAA